MEKRFVFSTPITYTFKDTIHGPQFFVEGHASTSGVDLVNDICTVNCLKSMKEQMLKRNIKLDLEHESFRGATQEEKELNKTIIPAGKIVDAIIDKTGLKIKALINPHSPRYEQTKGNIELEMLDAFSIAFIPTKISIVERKGEKIRLLEDVKLLNIALTGNPVNTEAQITNVFTKSIDSLAKFLEEKEKNPDMADLEVKRTSRQTQRNQAVNEDEDEEEETKLEHNKKKKKKALMALDEIKSYLTQEGKDNLNMEDKNMGETKESSTEETEKESDNSESEDQEGKEESNDESDEESSEESEESSEESSEAPATHEDIKSLKSEIVKLQKEVKNLKEVKAADRTAQSKARSESTDNKSEKTEEKSQGPLSMIN